MLKTVQLFRSLVLILITTHRPEHPFLAERSAEVAVAREAQIESESSEIVVLRKQVQRTCQPQPRLVAIQRYALHLLEELRQVNRRNADLGSDFGERPAPREVARQHELGSVHDLLPTDGAPRGMGRMKSQCPP